MEEQLDRLVKKTWEKHISTPPSHRLLIAIAGIPGSGKTTFATHLVQSLNLLSQSHSTPPSPTHPPPPALLIPMDGYHHPRSYLSTLPPSLHAFARRGAPFTFNAPAYLSLITALRAPLTPSTPPIYAPSFDHAVKDPVENAIAIPPTAKICVFEGNYVALDKGEWKEAAEMMDEVWFVEVEEVVAERRLVERHVRTGVEETEERARVRVRGNDLVNGREIVGNRVKVDEVVRSVEEEGWRPVKAEGRG